MPITFRNLAERSQLPVASSQAENSADPSVQPDPFILASPGDARRLRNLVKGSLEKLVIKLPFDNSYMSTSSFNALMDAQRELKSLTIHAPPNSTGDIL